MHRRVDQARYQLGGNPSRAEKTVALLEAIAFHPNIRLYVETQAAGYYADHWIPLVDRDRLSKLRAKAVIVASGVYEQPAVFHNNDLPGVMLASAAQRLIYRYAVKPMQRAVVLVANSDGYRAALDLAAHGVVVMAIVDLRPTPAATILIQTVKAQNIPIFTEHCIYEAKRNPAGDGLSSAVICPFDGNKPQLGGRRTIACDGIVVSVGWAPAANLLYQAGAKLRFDDQLQQFVPDRLPAGVFACGRVNGVFEFEQKMLDGDRAGKDAAAYLGMIKSNQATAEPPPNPQYGGNRTIQSPPVYSLRHSRKGDLGGEKDSNEVKRDLSAHDHSPGSAVEGEFLSLSNRPPSTWQKLCGFRRRFAAQGFLQRCTGRIRQH